jgi:hypothetical protein
LLQDSDVAESIDNLLTVELEHRPAKTIGLARKLYKPVREITHEPIALSAGRRICDAVKPGDIAVVSSGWVIDYWYPKGELCGMIGAVSLTRILTQLFRAKVLFLTEEPVVPVVNQTAASVGMRTYDYEHWIKSSSPSVSILPFPIEESNAQNLSEKILLEVSPSAIVTIEKAGRNINGVYHTGPGNDMSSSTARVDTLVQMANKRSVLTVGVGDLGNEIGFGKIRESVEKALPQATKCLCPCGGGIASAIETDSLVIASASNRGGYGLEAVLALLKDRPEMMHTGKMEMDMITAASQAGAIDSFTVSPTKTDGHGVPMEASSAFVDVLRQVILAKHQEFPMFEKRA